MNYGLGCIPDSHDSRDLMFHASSKMIHNEKLPKSANALEEFLPPVINQMSVGMCTGASFTRAAKTRMNFTGYPHPFMPSALFLYARTRQFTNTPLTEDTGCQIRDVFKVANQFGVCAEDSNPQWSWPFSASDERWTVDPPDDCDTNALLHKCVKYMRLGPSENEIKSALANNMPVVIGVAVRNSFYGDKVTKTGVIPAPGRRDTLLGGHAMFLWGYGNHKKDMADGRNSWGKDWGDDGNFHIPFELLCDPAFTSDRWAIEVYS